MNKELTICRGVLAAVAVVALVALGRGHAEEFVNPDTGQLVSVARNLLDGRGISTSVLYYEEQYAAGTIPAPQTIWPPGFSLLIAAFMAIGVPELTAAFWISIASHVLIAPILFFICRGLAILPAAACGVGVAWLLLCPPALLPLTAFQEPTFAALTLLSLLAFQTACFRVGAVRVSWMLSAGGFAAAAFAVRYIGVTFIGAVGLYLFARWIRHVSRERTYDLISFSLIPAAVCALIFGRNLLHAGNLTGGPSIDNPAGLIATVKAVYWAGLATFGVFGAGALRALGEVVLLVAGAAVLLVALPRLLMEGTTRQEESEGRLLWVCMLYCVATAALVVLLAWDRTADLIQWRYFAPVVPFVLLFSATAISVGERRVRGRSLRVGAWGAGVLLAGVLLVSQLKSLAAWDSYFVNVANGRAISAALSEPMGAASIRDHFMDQVGPGERILTPDGQVLGALVRQPVLGLASPFYTARIWSGEEVEALVHRYHVDWVVFFPGIFHPEGDNDSNKAFFADLARDKLPEWLKEVHRSERVRLFAVDWAVFNGIRQPPQ